MDARKRERIKMLIDLLGILTQSEDRKTRIKTLELLDKELNSW